MEPPGAAGAGVQPENAVLLLQQILVGVAEHHRVDPGQVRRDLLFVVDHIEGHTPQGDGAVVGDLLRPLLVVVAPDNVEGRVLLQLLHNAWLVDVPAVENGIGGFQKLRHLQPQQAVGVGQNGQFHRVPPPAQMMMPSQWSISCWIIWAVQPVKVLIRS